MIVSTYSGLSPSDKTDVITKMIEGPIVQDGIYSIGIPKIKFPDNNI
jgi:hypothetical protein